MKQIEKFLDEGLKEVTDTQWRVLADIHEMVSKPERRKPGQDSDSEIDFQSFSKKSSGNQEDVGSQILENFVLTTSENCKACQYPGYKKSAHTCERNKKYK